MNCGAGYAIMRKKGTDHPPHAKTVLDRRPCEPRCVRILNTGATLSAKIQKLPEYFSDENGEALTMLHIAGIPVDSLENEAVILEIDW